MDIVESDSGRFLVVVPECSKACADRFTVGFVCFAYGPMVGGVKAVSISRLRIRALKPGQRYPFMSTSLMAPEMSVVQCPFLKP